MDQNDRDLLLRDLSARLLYAVKVVRYIERNNKVEQLIPEMDLSLRLFELSLSNQWFIIKPYLRPLSSMTEDEKKEYFSFIGGQKPFDSDFYIYPKEYRFIYEWDVDNYVKWLHAHHFDYRGLIEKGIALEAPEGMYKLTK